MNTPLEAEEWRAVVGYEGFYEVSSHGRVRSLDRVVFQRRGQGQDPDAMIPTRLRGKIIKPMKSCRRRYLTVNICAGHRPGVAKGKTRTRFVHHLVAEAFIGPRPPGMHWLHGDDDQMNNRADNIRAGTPKENGADAMRNKVHKTGENHARSIFTQMQVAAIRGLKGEVGQRSLARHIGCSKGAVQEIHRGNNWREVVPLPVDEAKMVLGL